MSTTKYKPIKKEAITAGDIVKVYRNHGNPHIIRVDSHPTNSGRFTGHDRTGRRYFHIYIYCDIIKAWTKA